MRIIKLTVFLAIVFVAPAHTAVCLTCSGEALMQESARRKPHAKNWIDRAKILAIGEASLTVSTQERVVHTYSVTPQLATGNLPGKQFALQSQATPEESYRMSDVRIGDIVCLLFHRNGNADIVARIQILRRPGGRVPPSPINDPTSTYHYHDHMNALQDYEERGIPIPARYDIDKQILEMNEWIARRKDQQQRLIEK